MNLEEIIQIDIVMPKERLNPDVIIKSGQVFRMYKLHSNVYVAYTGDSAVSFRWNNKNQSWQFFTSWKDWDNIWKSYFDLDTNYQKFNKIILNSSDEFLKNALKNSEGMRILHQDLWETLVTFIISQQNNIPKIQKTVEMLCKNYGNVSWFSLPDGTKQKFYTFPSAEQIADLSLPKFMDGSFLGFRAKYILNLARDVRKGAFDLERLPRLSYSEAVNQFQSLYGVGPKIANCVTLYGLHKMESYPVDTWVKRIIQQDYSQYSEAEYMRYINESYKGFQGYVQQIQFYYKRFLNKK